MDVMLIGISNEFFSGHEGGDVPLRCYAGHVKRSGAVGVDG